MNSQAPSSQQRWSSSSEKFFLKLSDNQLLTNMQKLVRTERKITLLILSYINEIERRGLYLDLGYDSIYNYLIKGLGYSNGSAYRRIQSARLLQKLPNISKKIESGTLNITQLSHLQKEIKTQNKLGNKLSTEETTDLLSKLENKDSFETQKIIAIEMDLPLIKKDKLTPQKDDSIRMEFTLSREQFEEFELSKSLLSHICYDGKWPEILTFLAKNFNDRKLKGRTHKTSSPITQHSPATGFLQPSAPKNRRYVSVEIRRELLSRAKNRCEFRDQNTGRRCLSRHQLQVEHITPIALGGGNEIENLRIFCRKHNAREAEKLGLGI